MPDFLTTKELQAILHVDRTTIYRMAENGRLPAVKVGGQWRFPRQQIDGWLRQGAAASAPLTELGSMGEGPTGEIFPLECVQLIQDSFADALGVMILLTDLDGQSITRPSNPCGLFTAAEVSPVARQRCLDLWARIASDPSMTPRFVESHLGLMCARGLIRVGSEIRAMLVLGGFAPPHWPPGDERIVQMAADLDLPPDVLRQHIDQVHRLEAAQQAQALSFVQRIADIFAHIAQERLDLAGRLQRIAEISRL
jgi:excisionase family DNA binding protein